MTNDNPYWALVYGTLKKGERNDIQMLNAKFVREDRTAQPNFLMREYASASSPGSFSPGVLEAEPGKGSHIEGELYSFDEALLAKLDLFEGLPRGIYKRLRHVPLEGGGLADIYIRLARGNIVMPPKFVHFDDTRNSYKWVEKNAY
ncbi:MAG TPA: gamma-glutamylcyclotransferase family protein [Alphaproteobacteria bacterium]